MGPQSVTKWFNIPAIQRKEYERNMRIARNEQRHEQQFPKKEVIAVKSEDK